MKAPFSCCQNHCLHKAQSDIVHPMKRVYLSMLALWAPVAFASAEIKLVRIPMDGFAATVNTNIITIGSVYEVIQEASQRLRALHSGKELEEKSIALFMSGLERLIDQSLIVEDFNTQKFQMPERLVDDEINDIVTKRYNGDRAAMLSALEENKVTLEEWRGIIRNQLIVRMMRSREIGERIVVSPRQIAEAYEIQREKYNEPAKVRLRMIYVNAGTKVDEARQKAGALRATVAGGEDFEAVARENSDDASASTGGDWGWIEADQLRVELRNAIADAPAGSISEVVEIPEGFYVLKVEERKEAQTRTFEEVRSTIETELREKQGEKYYREWIARLRDKYPVVYHIPVSPTGNP